MDAVEFLEDFKRLCKSTACSNCSLWVDDHCCCMMDAKCAISDDFYPGQIISAVEKWAKDHPVKTRQSEFLKIAPLAPVSKQGVLEIRPCEVDKHPWFEECDFDCDKCCRAYWLQEVD